MPKTITLLGSTGSIGTQSLDVARMHGYRIFGLAANSRVEILQKQIEEFHPEYVAVVDPAACEKLDAALAGTANAPKLLKGPEGLRTLAAMDGPDVVLNAVVGIAGLPASLAAIESGHDLALANKESLVTGGHLVTDAVKKCGVKLLPVDSEHSAIFQCLQDKESAKSLTKILLTASGGPFFGMKTEELRGKTKADALKHPNWNMGAKITIDSATLMNKGLELIEAVCTAVPALRVRLGSLEPRIVTEDFCRRLSRLPNLCPQFHLSMQSGCDTVLQRMRRKYDTARYYESVCLLRTWFPGCAVTTDMIVAFPGETEDEFAQSLAFIRKCGFAEMHIFPYSRRPGTPADKMPGQHGNAVKEARSRAAIAVAEEMSRAYREALVGSVQSVLFESVEDGLFTGHTPNYVKVYVPGAGLHNQVRRVRITGLCKAGLAESLEP